MRRGRPVRGRRHVNVSESVLDALARALSLNDTERDRLFAVARPDRTRRAPMPAQRVRPGLRAAGLAPGGSPGPRPARRPGE